MQFDSTETLNNFLVSMGNVNYYVIYVFRNRQLCLLNLASTIGIAYYNSGSVESGSSNSISPYEEKLQYISASVFVLPKVHLGKFLPMFKVE